MTISNKDKKLLVYLVALGLISIAYFFVAKPFLAKQDAINQEINKLKADVNHYSEIRINRDTYEQMTVDAQVEYNETLAKFAGGLDQENTLMMIKDLEENSNVWINRVSFQDIEAISGEPEVPMENPDEVSGEESEADVAAPVSMVASRQVLNIDFSGKYKDFKKFIDYINNYHNRLYISSINAGYSVDSNEVAGNMTVVQYSIVSQDNPYEAPDLSNIGTGVENIFTSLTGESMAEETVQDITVQSLENEDASENQEDGETEETEESDSDSEESENDDSEKPAEEEKKPKTGGIV